MTVFLISLSVVLFGLLSCAMYVNDRIAKQRNELHEERFDLQAQIATLKAELYELGRANGLREETYKSQKEFIERLKLSHQHHENKQCSQFTLLCAIRSHINAEIGPEVKEE